MKGITTQTILIIVAIVIVGVLLYYAFVKGFWPFGAEIDEARCHTDIMAACSARNWDPELKELLIKCWSYIERLPDVTNCAACKATPTDENCGACCSADLAGWAV